MSTTLFSFLETSNYIGHALLHLFHSLKTSRLHCFFHFKLDSLDSKTVSSFLSCKYLLCRVFHVLEPWICPRRGFLLLRFSKTKAEGCSFSLRPLNKLHIIYLTSSIFTSHQINETDFLPVKPRNTSLTPSL